MALAKTDIEGLEQYLTKEELDELDALMHAEELTNRYDWSKHQLPYQRLPVGPLALNPHVSREYGAGKAGNDNYNAVAWICGIGAGKTTTQIQNLRTLVEQGKYKRIGIITPTEKLYREEIALPLVESSPDWCKAVYRANEAKILWPNGAQAILLSAQTPRLIKGFNLDCLCCDEIVGWAYPESYRLGRERLRIGDNPLTLVSTTPESTPLIWSILNDPDCAVITASTYDNTTLSPEAIKAITGPYIGHPLFEQQIMGRIFERIAGALWTPEVINANRIVDTPELVRVVVGVDPGAYSADGDDTGVVVCAKCLDGSYVVLADYSRAKGSPEEAARAMISAYHDHQADKIAVEVNNGGDWLISVINSIDPTVNIGKVYATRSKQLRAEPISAMYARGEVKHLGFLNDLERQMREWVPGRGKSPGRLDALVFSLTELAGRSRELKVY